MYDPVVARLPQKLKLMFSEIFLHSAGLLHLKKCKKNPLILAFKASINKIALFSNFRPAALYGLQIMIHDIIGFVQDILCG